MKTRILSAIILLLGTFSLNSCGVLPNHSEDRMATFKVFQTLWDGSALCFDSYNNVARLISSEEVYYDGKTVSGFFVFLDTYTYTNKDGIQKTVPVYSKYSECRKLLRKKRKSQNK